MRTESAQYNAKYIGGVQLMEVKLLSTVISQISPWWLYSEYFLNEFCMYWTLGSVFLVNYWFWGKEPAACEDRHCLHRNQNIQGYIFSFSSTNKQKRNLLKNSKEAEEPVMFVFQLEITLMVSFWELFQILKWSNLDSCLIINLVN